MMVLSNKRFASDPDLQLGGEGVEEGEKLTLESVFRMKLPSRSARHALLDKHKLVNAWVALHRRTGSGGAMGCERGATGRVEARQVCDIGLEGWEHASPLAWSHQDTQARQATSLQPLEQPLRATVLCCHQQGRQLLNHLVSHRRIANMFEPLCFQLL